MAIIREDEFNSWRGAEVEVEGRFCVYRKFFVLAFVKGQLVRVGSVCLSLLKPKNSHLLLKPLTLLGLKPYRGCGLRATESRVVLIWMILPKNPKPWCPMLMRYARASLFSVRLFSTEATAASVAPGPSANKAVTTTKGAAKSGGERVPDTLGYRLIGLVYPKRSAVVTIQKWKEEGRTACKYELNRVVRELRKFKRYKHALEVINFLFIYFLDFSTLMALEFCNEFLVSVGARLNSETIYRIIMPIETGCVELLGNVIVFFITGII